MLVRGGGGKGWGLGEEAGGAGRGQVLQGLLRHLKELGGYEANILGFFPVGLAVLRLEKPSPGMDAQPFAPGTWKGDFRYQHASQGGWRL